MICKSAAWRGEDGGSRLNREKRVVQIRISRVCDRFMVVSLFFDSSWDELVNRGGKIFFL
jgi:hypothetical protein